MYEKTESVLEAADLVRWLEGTSLSCWTEIVEKYEERSSYYEFYDPETSIHIKAYDGHMKYGCSASVSFSHGGFISFTGLDASQIFKTIRRKVDAVAKVNRARQLANLRLLLAVGPSEMERLQNA